MCLGIPAEVKEVKGHVALVDFGDGVLREVDAGAIDDLRPGDLVIVHAGVVIEKINEERAKEMIQLFEEFISELERKADEIEKLLGLEKATE